MLRFLLFRFLPRRIVPLLALYEVYRLIRDLRREDRPSTTGPRPVRGETRDVTQDVSQDVSQDVPRRP